MTPTTPAPNEDSFPTAQVHPAPVANVSMLARLALEQGIAFDDVEAYLVNLRTAQRGWR